MSIIEAHVKGLDRNFKSFSPITVLKRTPEDTDASIERRAHIEAAQWLDAHYKGYWLYRYANLIDGVTTETPGTYPSKYTPGEVDGVTDMSLIADGGFRGQFQWNDAAWTDLGQGLGGYVPAAVSTVDPEREARYAAAREAQHLEDEKAKQALETRLATLPAIELAPYKELDYAAWKTRNSEDGYSLGVVTFAERWARLMQAELEPLAWSDEGISPDKFGVIAERTSHEADVEGITGFMYGCAVKSLAEMWIHGEVLRVWHNGQYGVTSKSGTVNPAILTVG